MCTRTDSGALPERRSLWCRRSGRRVEPVGAPSVRRRRGRRGRRSTGAQTRRADVSRSSLNLLERRRQTGERSTARAARFADPPRARPASSAFQRRENEAVDRVIGPLTVAHGGQRRRRATGRKRPVAGLRRPRAVPEGEQPSKHRTFEASGRFPGAGSGPHGWEDDGGDAGQQIAAGGGRKRQPNRDHNIHQYNGRFVQKARTRHGRLV